MKTLQLVLVIVITSLAGCSSMLSQNTNQKTRSSSLVDFLYPDEQSRQAHQPSIPTLNLPATVVSHLFLTNMTLAFAVTTKLPCLRK